MMSDEDMRETVKEGYEDIDLSSHQSPDDSIPQEEQEIVNAFIGRIPDGGHIVDMGCGTGVPYDQELVSRGYYVTGVDIAETNIETAKEFVPEADFIQADFSTFSPDTEFDGLLCLYALFHLPRDEHREVLERFHSILSEEAPMLVTVGTADVEEMDEKFLGEEMVWSFFDAERNLKLIEEAGFVIRKAERIPDPVDDGEHLWVLAEKR